MQTPFATPFATGFATPFAGFDIGVIEDQVISFGRKTIVSAGLADFVNGEFVYSGSNPSSLTLGTRTVGSDHFGVSGNGVVPTSVPTDVQYVWTDCFADTLGPFTLTINTVADSYSTNSTAEIEAAAAVAADDDTILHRSTNIVAPDLSSLTFTVGNPLVVKAEHSIKHASNPKLSTRPATITGSVDLSSSTAVTVSGFEVNGDVDRDGTNANLDGVFIVTLSDSCTVENCLIYSEADLRGATEYKKIAGVVTDLQLQRAFYSPTSSEIIDFLILDNEIRDCYNLVGSNCDGLYCKRNVCTRLYVGFVVSRGTGNVYVYDNVLESIWGGAADTTTASGLIHAGMGGGDPQNGVIQDNINWIGNTLTVGTERFLYDGATTAATGVKFNDPKNGAGGTALGYSNVDFLFNTVIIGSNFAVEYSGVTDGNILNNTIIRSEDWKTQGTGGAPATGVGAINLGDEDGITTSGISIFNNIFEAVSAQSDFTAFTGLNDGSDGMQLFNNSFVKDAVSAGVNSRNSHDYFVGPITTEMTTTEMESAYVPNSWTWALNAPIKQGSLGTGYYTRGDDGVHTAPTVTVPVSATGTAHTFSKTVWAGDVSYQADSMTSETNGDVFTILCQGQFATDDASESLIASSGGQIQLLRFSSGNRLRFALENPAGEKILQAETINNAGTIFHAGEPFALAVSIAANSDRLTAGINGNSVQMVQTNPLDTTTMMKAGDVNYDNILLAAMGTVNATDQFNGKLDMFALDQRFIDLDTVAGLQSVFSSTGPFIDLSSAGYSIYASGDAATVGTTGWQTGPGVEFTTKEGSGTVTDDAAAVNETVWESGDYFNLASAGLAVTSSDGFTMAVKMRVKDLSAITYVFAEDFDTYFRVNTNGSIRIKIEDNAGTILVDQSHGTGYVLEDEVSLVLAASQTDCKLYINNASVFATTFSTANPIVLPEMMNAINPTGSQSNALNYFAIWAASDYIDPATFYSSFFDGTDTPTAAMLAGDAINSVTPDFSESGDAAAWNGYSDPPMTGTVTDA